MEYQTRQSDFPKLDQYIYSRELVKQEIQDATVVKFRRLGSSLNGISSDTLLPGWTTNAKTVGASANDVSAFSTLGRVVWTLGFATDALSLGMVRTSL
jgi:hypothetical protein